VQTLWTVPVVLAMLLQLLACRCSNTTKVGSIVSNPRKYVGTTVTVQGEVTERMNLLALKYFRIKDATGDILIVTDRVLPVEGTNVRITGKVEELSIGPWQGLVIREERAAKRHTR
jgi:hypothetical protein